MKKQHIAAISALCGFVIGAAASGICVYGKCKLKFTELMKKELKDPPEPTKYWHTEEDAKAAHEEYTTEDDIPEEVVEETTSEVKAAEFARSKPAITDYTKYFTAQASPEAVMPGIEDLTKSVSDADLRVPDIPFLKPNESVFDAPMSREEEEEDVDADEDPDEDSDNDFYETRIDFRESEIIDEDEIGEYRSFDTDNLNLYADGFLVDDMFNVIEEPEYILTSDQLKDFMDSKNDILCVRSYRLRTDYQIVKDVRAWTDILKKKPYLEE